MSSKICNKKDLLITKDRDMKSTENPGNTNLSKLSGLGKFKFPKSARTSRLKFKDMNHIKILKS